ncbi:unnamed protein product [Rhizoctonia solani]|uniref:F-box domain-containing protein n=1 Tax=Rhizoctonia solani TaxID=456999 RepID=A0A8H2Y3M2_9AGAM|nr:unnamed protein product [Rhizoctonia solani]
MPGLETAAGWDVRNPLLFPELAHLVYEWISRRDRINLAISCKALFRLLIPWLWRRLVNVEALLRLIPGTVVTREYRDHRVTTHIKISESALTEAWERFWVYAPVIDELTIWEHDGPLALYGWDILPAKRMESEGPLLPNLRVLNIFLPNPTDPTIDPIGQLAWFSLFSSPSIRSLRLRNYPTRSNYGHSPGSKSPSPSALLLLNTLAKSFNGSQSIALSSYYDFPTADMIASTGSGVYTEYLDWLGRLPALIHLTHLNLCSCAVSGGLGEGFIVLGHLPHLEMLEITENSSLRSNPGFRGELLPIPSSLYPCLQKLRIESTPTNRLFYHIWGSVAMASKLTKASIHFIMDFPIVRDEFVFTIIPLLCNKSPKLVDLNICAELEPNNVNNTGTPETEMLFELLRRLSLSSLSFRVGTGKATESYFPHCPLAFPLLAHLELRVPLYPAQLRVLAATLPNIHDLKITLWLDSQGVGQAREIVSKPNEPASLKSVSAQVRLEGLSNAGSDRMAYFITEDKTNPIARFLKFLWPNLNKLVIH